MATSQVRQARGKLGTMLFSTSRPPLATAIAPSAQPRAPQPPIYYQVKRTFPLEMLYSRTSFAELAKFQVQSLTAYPLKPAMRQASSKQHVAHTVDTQ
ncbi:hypothetical protein HaLaN_04371 [Haematococcus lacustris]|uniref:Uncharacterized protein n=1 Tax=Haematococcus lacustris TaxID=44745 RepID=A0A699YGP6_HAELA|nr:hypothetical protein HaLaN_04371 [Haematococcus lacustris]